jgi:hypothetical protein
VKRENVSGSVLVHVHIASKVLNNSSVQYKTCVATCQISVVWPMKIKKRAKAVLWFAADFILPNAELLISGLYTVYSLAKVTVECRLLLALKLFFTFRLALPSL